MGEQIRNYLANGIGQFIAYLPALITGLIILVVGYLISRALGTLARRLLIRAGFDDVVARRLHPRASAPHRPASGTIGSAVFWLAMLVTLSLAAQALRLETLANGINQILAYVPRVAVAALIVGIAIAVANVLSDVVSDVSSRWLARGVRIAVIALSVFMALDQLGVAQGVVLTAFTALIGAVAVAIAIAFGVGNIELAREYTRKWERRQAASRAERERRASSGSYSSGTVTRGPEEPPMYPPAH